MQGPVVSTTYYYDVIRSLGATENAGVEMNDVARIRNNGQNIRRPEKKSNILQDKAIKSCLSRFDSGAYNRLQFLSAVSHSVSAHTEAFRQTDDNSSSSSNGERRQLIVSLPASWSASI